MEPTKQKLLTIKEGKQFLSTLPDATNNMIYVVIGPFCWGKDINAVKAAKNARFNGIKGDYRIHLVNKECQIDSMNGTLYYDSRVEGIKLNIALFRQS